MGLERGVKSAEQSQEQEKKRGRRPKQWGYLSLDFEESITLHPIDDPDVYWYAQVHVLTPTRPIDPTWDEDRKKFWRAKNDAVCPVRKPFDGEFCWICQRLHEHEVNDFTKSWKGPDAGKWRPRLHYFVPCIVREPVEATQAMIDAGEIPATIKMGGIEVPTLGQVINHQVKMIDLPVLDEKGEETGETKSVPQMVLIKQPTDWFTAQFMSDFKVYGTTLNRDYTVKLTKNAQGKREWFISSNPTPDFDLRVPQLREQFADIINVEELLTRLASPEYHLRYFNRDEPFPEGEDKGEDRNTAERPASPAADTEPSADVPDADDEDQAKIKAKIAEMQSRLKPSAA